MQKGNLLKSEWLKFYQDNLEFESIYLSFDTALKANDNNSFSVCAIFGVLDNRYYIIDLFRARLEYPQLLKEALNLVGKYKPNAILIEDKASGQSLIQDLKLKIKIPVIAIKPKLDKITRFSMCLPIFESGKVFINRNNNWWQEYQKELLLFPFANCDDQVDATSQFLNYINSRILQPKIKVF